MTISTSSGDFPRDRFESFVTQSPERVVCKRCHVVMNNAEPCTFHGEYYHPRIDKTGKPYLCKNAGEQFSTKDMEVEPFMNKSRRRALKRMDIRP